MKENNVPSNITNNDAPVASHTASVGNANQLYEPYLGTCAKQHPELYTGSLCGKCNKDWLAEGCNNETKEKFTMQDFIQGLQVAINDNIRLIKAANNVLFHYKYGNSSKVFDDAINELHGALNEQSTVRGLTEVANR